MNQLVTAALRRGNKKACGFALATALAMAPVLSHAGFTNTGFTETLDSFTATYAFTATPGPDSESLLGSYWQTQINLLWNLDGTYYMSWTGHHDGAQAAAAAGNCSWDGSIQNGTVCSWTDVAVHLPDQVDEYNLILQLLNGGGTLTFTGQHYPENLATPVPAAVWLFGSGLAGLVAVAHRRKPAR